MDRRKVSVKEIDCLTVWGGVSMEIGSAGTQVQIVVLPMFSQGVLEQMLRGPGWQFAS